MHRPPTGGAWEPIIGHPNRSFIFCRSKVSLKQPSHQELKRKALQGSCTGCDLVEGLDLIRLDLGSPK